MDNKNEPKNPTILQICLNGEIEKRIWIAAFECKCRLTQGPRDIDYAIDAADYAVTEYRNRTQ